MHDAIVIGAGPAGCSAARRLAQRGLGVLLLERARLPRYKPCGGGLTDKAIRLLDFDIGPVLEIETRRALLMYDGASPVERTLDGASVRMVMRDRFDAFLAQKAVEAGAVLRDGIKVESVERLRDEVAVRCERETLHARYVIGADGANGITARSVGLMQHRHAGAALEAELHVAQSALERWRNQFLLDFGTIPWGYGWVFPKAEHLSVGVGTYTPTGAINLRDHLAKFLGQHPDLRGDMTVKGHLVPLGGRRVRLDAGRVALAGDAGAAVDPFLGEGISHAIHSGHSAADTVIAAQQRNDGDLSEHSRRVHAEINADFGYARMLTNIFYRAPAFWYRFFIARGALTSEMVGVVAGTGGYRQILTTVITQAPGAVVRALLRRSAQPASR